MKPKLLAWGAPKLRLRHNRRPAAAIMICHNNHNLDYRRCRVIPAPSDPDHESADMNLRHTGMPFLTDFGPNQPLSII